jgi:hypothetical protein
MSNNNATILSFSFKYEMTNSIIDDGADCYFNITLPPHSVSYVKDDLNKIMQMLTNLHCNNKF